MRFNKYIFAILFLVVFTANAQVDKVSIAITYVEKGDLTRAMQSIDSTVLMPDYFNDGRAWYIRGYVYSQVFRKSFPEPKNIKWLGEVAYNSFLESNRIDTSSENRIENNKSIYNLSVYFNNYAAKFLDSTNIEYAIISMDNYKQCQLYVNPSTDFKTKDIEFYNALASVHKGIYEKNITQNPNDVLKKVLEEHFQQAIEYYYKVLSIDSNNYDANFNQAILYYNQGAEMINSMPVDEDILIMTDILDKTSEIFKNSLPLMLKADDLRPNRRETLVGLRQIYQALLDDEKKQEYNNKLVALEKK